MSEILKKAFEINLNDYENINFNLEINKVVLGFYCSYNRYYFIQYVSRENKTSCDAAFKTRGVF